MISTEFVLEIYAEGVIAIIRTCGRMTESGGLTSRHCRDVIGKIAIGRDPFVYADARLDRRGQDVFLRGKHGKACEKWRWESTAWY